MKTLRVSLSLAIIGIAVWGMVYDVLKRHRSFYAFSIDTSSLENSEFDLNIEAELLKKGFFVQQKSEELKLTGGELVAKKLTQWVNDVNERLTRTHRERQRVIELKNSIQKQKLAQIEQKRTQKELHLQFLNDIINTDLKPFQPWIPEAKTIQHRQQKKLSEAVEEFSDNTEQNQSIELNSTSRSNETVISQSSNLIVVSPEDQHLDVEVMANRHPHFKLLLSSRDHFIKAAKTSGNISFSANTSANVFLRADIPQNEIQSAQYDLADQLASANVVSSANHSSPEIVQPKRDYLVENKPQAHDKQQDKTDHQPSHSLTPSGELIVSANIDLPAHISVLKNEFKSQLSNVADNLSSTVSTLSKVRKDELHEIRKEFELSRSERASAQRVSMDWFNEVYAQVFESLKVQGIWRKQWLQNSIHKLQSDLLDLKHQQQSIPESDLMVRTTPPRVILSKHATQIDLSELKHGYRYLLFGFAACFALNLIWEAISQRSKL